MIPIATLALVIADQLWLTAADDPAWPECASTAPTDHSFAREPQPKGSLRLSSASLAPLATARAAPTNARCTRPSQPNPHSAR
jgi:hypothetical protein